MPDSQGRFKAVNVAYRNSGRAGHVSVIEVIAPLGSHNGIEYSRVAGAPLELDACIPDGPGPYPAAIVVHGGGWVRGDRRVDVEPLLAPLSEAGFAWFSISYRLMKDVTQFGVAVEDVEAAVRYVKSHAEEFRVDPNRIALVGESACGHLAALAALKAGPALKVRAVVALSAPLDLMALAKGSSYVPQWVHDNLRSGGLAWLIKGRLKQLSPMEFVRRDMPPFLLIHGVDDPLVPFEQSRGFYERTIAAGARCELFPVTGVGHGIRWWESTPAAAALYKDRLVRWLLEQLQ